MIPVVLQPNKEFYNKMAPKNSFIHASDFNYDTKKLGEYLKKVSNSFEFYYSYVKWKQHYSALFRAKELEQFRICELCYRLNTQKKKSYYSSVSNFFNDQCTRE